MYKNIIPSLVSIDTKIKKIRGLHICQNMSFFRGVEFENKFHYKVYLKKKIEIPQQYDFRSEYFIKKNGKWYYERKMWFLNFKFIYDPQNKTFYFNRLYSLLPFRIGGIFMVGEHISNLVNLDLFLNEFILFRGCAFQKNNRVSCVVAPGFNGKTTLLKKILSGGGKYIAEDLLIFDLKKNQVFPTCPFLKNPFLQGRKTISFKVMEEKIIKNPLPIDELFLIQNSLNEKYEPKNKELIDFVILTSLYFFNDGFIKSIIFEEKLSKKILEKITRFQNDKINYKFLNIKNFKVHGM